MASTFRWRSALLLDVARDVKDEVVNAAELDIDLRMAGADEEVVLELTEAQEAADSLANRIRASWEVGLDTVADRRVALAPAP